MSTPVHLRRETATARQAGGATVIGLILVVIGGWMLLVARRVEAAGGQQEWLAYVVGASFTLVGIVMLFVAIKLYLITRLPETVVEVDAMPVRAGQPFHVTVRQPGPIRLKSLRVNVVGEQITRYEVWRKGSKRIETDRHLIHQNNVIDLRDLTIRRGEEFASGAEAIVPGEVTLLDIEGTKAVVWRLEVWGRVRGWVNFGHPFVLTVVGGMNRVADTDG